MTPGEQSLSEYPQSFINPITGSKQSVTQVVSRGTEGLLSSLTYVIVNRLRNGVKKRDISLSMTLSFSGYFRGLSVVVGVSFWKVTGFVIYFWL